MGYQVPAVAPISSDYKDHRRRNPPSSEPGTDYACAYGTPLLAAGTGTVVDIKHSNSGAMGRYVTIDLDDGRRVRYLHLSEVWVRVGQRVSASTYFGASGGSAWGSDWGVGAHVHVTLWPGHYYEFTPTGPIDFERYVGGGGGGGTLQPHQRQVVSNASVNGRGEPNTSSAVRQTLPAGTVGDFDAWIHGETVEGNSIWFRGLYSSDWFWSGGFASQSTDGLTDMNAPKPTDPIGPQQRQVVANASANGRSAPNTSATINQTLDAGTVGNFDGWAHGESVEGNNIWYRGLYSKDWFWSGGFTSQSTSGLQQLTPDQPTPEPEPTPDRPGTEADYTPDLVTPSRDDFPKWIQYDEVIDPESLQPELNKDAYFYYGEKYDPIESHTHWWNEPGKGGSHEGNVSYLRNTDDLSVNYVTSAGRITLMVPLNKIALTTGKRNPYAWKSENDPLITTSESDLGYKTLGYLHYIVEKLNPRLLNEPIRLHKEFYSTSCSEIDVKKVREFADAFATGKLDPETGEPPVGPQPEPEPDTVPVSRADLEELKASLQDDLDLIESLLD